MSFELAGAVSSFLYGLAADRVSVKPLLLLGAFLLISGRTIAGLGAGVNTVGVSYLSSTTPVENRAKIIGIYWVVSLLGMVVGPGCTLPLSFVDWSQVSTPAGIIISDTTVPGWLNAIVTFLLVIPTVIFFRDNRRKKSEQQGQSVMEDAMERLESSEGSDSGSEAGSSPPSLASSPLSTQFEQPTNLDYKIDWVVYFFIGVGFWLMFTLNVFQTIVTPETKENFDWGPKENAYMFMAIGGVVVLTIFIVQVLLKWFSERVLLLVGEIFLICGVGLFCLPQHSQLWLFIILVGLLTFGFASATSILPSLYSKYIHPLDHGKWLGILNAAQGMAQVVGPLFGGFIMSKVRQLPMYLLAGIAAIFIAATVALFKRLIPDPHKFGNYVVTS